MLAEIKGWVKAGLIAALIASIAFCLGVGCFILVESITKPEVKPEYTVSFHTTVGITKEVPTYDYLKSVTVFISGCTSTCIDLGYGAVKCEESRCWSGTGIVVRVSERYTYILTNAHVAGKNKENISLFIRNGDKQIPAEIVKYHNNLDLAVLKVKGTLENKKEIKGVAIAKPQDALYLVGHHLGRKYLYGEGVFSGYDGVYTIIQIPCAFGNSGSGVFDVNGKLVAVVFAINSVNYFSYDTSHAVCVDGASVALFLEQLNLL